MPEHSLLAGLVITYAIGLLLVVLLARLRVPSIVALMLAGVVAGPGVLGIIGSTHDVETLAEIGIVLLLFTVGLDFSLAAMKQIWRTILAAGSMQIAGTAALVSVVVAIVAAFLVSEVARRQIGGYTGDVLGAAQEAAQLAIFVNLVSLA